MMPDYHALIVGAGFSGIGAAIKLDRAGFSDYLVVEAGDGVGGTWHWNTYPVSPWIFVLLLSVLFRAEPALVAHLCTRTRAEGLRRTLRRQIRHPVADPVEHQGACRRVR